MVKGNGEHVISEPELPGRLLASLTCGESAESIDSAPTIVLPDGAFEALGPHFELGTNVIIAQAAFQRAADQFEAIGQPAWIAHLI